MTFTDYVFEFSSGLNKTAIIDKKNISYIELYCKVLMISHNIKKINIVKEDKILLISENSPFFIESYFGIIKSGCTCVPLNPTLSKNDIEYIINSCNPKAIFIEKRFLDNMQSLINKDIKIVTEETLNNLLLDKECTSNNGEEEIDFKNSVAVILFTSGSTARPKGVMLTHHNLCHNTNSIIEYLSLNRDDRIEVVLPFYYCFGTSLLHTHLRVGGSLVINNKFMFPETVLDDIEKYECTGFAGVPSNYQILLRKSSVKDRNLKSLRYVAQAGGRLPDSFIKELKEALNNNAQIFIMYGQTEATARLSYLPPNMLDEKMGSIGKGIPGTLLKVIDKEGNQVKVDEIGEVVAFGENIMKGYFNDEEETKKVIRNGYLYTGDLATVDEDGYIYIVAREKQIIKSGGNRISPKEIENIVIQIPSVIEAAVIGVQDDILGEAVKAFVVLNDEVLKVDEKYIIEYCKDKLPSYKVPKYVVFLDGLPKNSSGKVMMGDLK
ncbi:class I adenylate-forming enzyme family protein [Clostridium beijerinckii]|uniref:Long-chain-fatty-acid--CoA ligase n=1 Tax=Clostridium beijerinckii TaxID=1520 RepID=A0A1S8S0Y7_CLOBE|nr:AMP-binding protein [Clostridium beijerinckii]NRY63009.1 acyl-CoA synthetase (AMP-forming)/AMP-acid ligase II [Clostridium beijerinckii]OOM59104.1 long-chain-fatty-acid--CoA ligase [Clostridium beijerinckii]